MGAALEEQETVIQFIRSDHLYAKTLYVLRARFRIKDYIMRTVKLSIWQKHFFDLLALVSKGFVTESETF